MTLSAQILDLFARRGDSQYGGEVVTQLEHALQCATLAEQAEAPCSLIVAALLHDIGHLLHDLPDDAPDQGVDDRHQNSGYNFINKHFIPAVAEPVRLHVDAKRYLCAREPSYRRQLSPTSLVSLELQGGNMSSDEVRAFENSPHWQHAVQLRRWDDLAKIEGFTTPDLQHFVTLIDEVVLSNDGPVAS